MTCNAIRGIWHDFMSKTIFSNIKLATASFKSNNGEWTNSSFSHKYYLFSGTGEVSHGIDPNRQNKRD